MDFSLSTDHEILRDSVRSFAEKEIKTDGRLEIAHAMDPRV